MSHGTILNDGSMGVFGVDGEMINILKEAKPIFSNEKCYSLKNKPKLFFIDACWGKSNMGVGNKTTKKPNSSDFSHICATCNNSYKSSYESENNLVLSDFLFSFSTVPNYVSLRDSDKGNWFIQEFTSALGEFGETRTLIDIMHTVRQKLMRKGTTYHAQMSVDHWMLSRHVLFKSKNKKIMGSSYSTTYLVNIFEKTQDDRSATGRINLLNKFHILPLLTQIGTSCKFASLGIDPKSIHIWLLLGNQIETLNVLSGHSHEVTALHSFDALHNNEKVSVLASGSEDGSIRIWSVRSGDCLQIILGHENILSLESIGMSKLASSSLDGTTRVWDISFHFQFELRNSLIRKNTRIRSFQIPKTCVHDPGMFFLGYNNKMYNSVTGALIQNLKDYNIEQFELVGGHQIAIKTYMDDIKLYDAKTGEVIQMRMCDKLLQKYSIKLLHFLSNKLLAVVCRYGDNKVDKGDYFIGIWDLKLGSWKQGALIEEKYLVSSLSLCKNKLVTGFRNGSILIFNVGNRENDHLARKDDNDEELLRLHLLCHSEYNHLSRKDHNRKQKNFRDELKRLHLIDNSEYNRPERGDHDLGISKYYHLARKDDNHGELSKLLLLDDGRMVSFYKNKILWNIGILKHAHASKHSNQSFFLLAFSQSLSKVQGLPTLPTTLFSFGVRTDLSVS